MRFIRAGDTSETRHKRDLSKKKIRDPGKYLFETLPGDQTETHTTLLYGREVTKRMKVNTKRQVEFDYIKTLALFFMVIIHVLEELSTYGAYEVIPAGFWENLIEFGAGPLAAPAFMCAMGVGIIYSRRSEPPQLFRRGVRILILAIGLNLVRGVIPTLTVSAIRGNIDPDRIFYLMFNVDILHFAGLSLMLTALLKKLHVPPLAFVPVAIAMQIIGNLLPPITADCSIPLYILGSFFHTSPLSAFPLLICYIHIAAGIAFGDILIRQKDPERFYRIIFWGSLSLLAGLLFTLVTTGYDLKNLYMLYNELYYQQTFLHFAFNTLVVLLELSIFHFMLERFRPAEGFALFCSKNVNSIYLIQWVIIGIWVGFGGSNFGFWGSVLWGLVIAFASIGFTRILPSFNMTGLRDESTAKASCQEDQSILSDCEGYDNRDLKRS